MKKAISLLILTLWPIIGWCQEYFEKPKGIGFTEFINIAVVAIISMVIGGFILRTIFKINQLLNYQKLSAKLQILQIEAQAKANGDNLTEDVLEAIRSSNLSEELLHKEKEAL